MKALNVLRSFYTRDNKVSIIVGGDFNSCPNSGIYTYMKEGEYDCCSVLRNEISGQHMTTSKLLDQRNPLPFFQRITHKMTNNYLHYSKIYNITSWFSEISTSFISHDITKEPKKLIFHRGKVERENVNEDNKDLRSKINIYKVGSNINPHIPNFHLVNPIGKFKSGYSEGILAIINHIINTCCITKDRHNKDSVSEKILEGEMYKYKESLWDLEECKDCETFKKRANVLIKRSTHEPRLSTYMDMTYTPDYIWYNSPSAIITMLYQFPSFTYISKYGKFPNPYSPSDHLPIGLNILIK